MSKEISNQTTITLDAATVGCIRGFSAPGEALKEVEVTCLADTLEQYQPSTLGVAQEFTLTNILESTAAAVSVGDAGSWVITFPSGQSWTFSGFVREAGSVDGDSAGDSVLEQTFTIRLTSVVTIVPAA
tara:strand:+ start:2733 stop:3119 length:387 start_codon:yes stop_codon:yes gene_type:complete